MLKTPRALLALCVTNRPQLLTPEEYQSFLTMVEFTGVPRASTVRVPPPFFRPGCLRRGWYTRKELEFPLMGSNLEVEIPLKQAENQVNAVLQYNSNNADPISGLVKCRLLMPLGVDSTDKAFLSYPPNFKNGTDIFLTDSLQNYVQSLYFLYCQGRPATSIWICGENHFGLRLLGTYGWRCRKLVVDLGDDSSEAAEFVENEQLQVYTGKPVNCYFM